MMFSLTTKIYSRLEVDIRIIYLRLPVPNGSVEA